MAQEPKPKPKTPTAKTEDPKNRWGDTQTEFAREKERQDFADAYWGGKIPKYDDPNWKDFTDKLELWRAKGKPMPRPSPSPSPSPSPLPEPSPSPSPETPPGPVSALPLLEGLLAGRRLG